MKSTHTTVGERIRSRRKELNLTQKDLAKRLGITAVSVSQWERDDSAPTGKNLYALTKILKCTPAWILFADEGSEPAPVEDLAFTLDERQRECLSLFDALPDSEQDLMLNEMRARVENFNRLFEELIKARQRSQKK